MISAEGETNKARDSFIPPIETGAVRWSSPEVENLFISGTIHVL